MFGKFVFHGHIMRLYHFLGKNVRGRDKGKVKAQPDIC
jgi:hypothetical protein